MKKFLKKAAVVLSIIFAAASLFAGSQPGGKNAADENLAGSIIFFTNRTDKADSTIRDIADEFEKLHPGAKVEIQSVESSQIPQVLGTRAAASELPDITLVLTEWSKEDWASYFLPLNDVFSRDDIYFYDDGVFDGNLYRISTALNFGGVIYNKNAFEKAGIKSTPKTWEEFYTACDKLLAAGIIPYGTNYKDSWPLEKIAFNYTRMFEGDINALNNLVTPGRTLFETGKGMLAGGDFLRTMYKKGYSEPDLMSTNWDSFKGQIARGEIAMTFLGSWFPPQIVENGLEPGKIGMFPLPGTKKLLLFADWRLAISKTTKSPKTAKAFLKFLFENDRYPKAVGAIPPTRGAAYNDQFAKEYFGSGLPTMEEIPDSQLYRAVYSSAQIAYSTMMQEYIIAEDPKTVINKYNSKWEKAIKENTN